MTIEELATRSYIGVKFKCGKYMVACLGNNGEGEFGTLSITLIRITARYNCCKCANFIDFKSLYTANMHNQYADWYVFDSAKELYAWMAE